MGKILVTARSFGNAPEAGAILAAAGHEIIRNPYDRPLREGEMLELIKGADALITGTDAVTAAVIAAGLPTLKIIAKYGVGYDNIDVAAASLYGLPVTITPGANTVSVAELAFALMLTAGRYIPAMDRSVRGGSWQRIAGFELNGKTLGIIGLGSIGSEVAKRAWAFNMKIIAYDKCHKQEYIDNYDVEYLPFNDVLARADFISLHAPVTADTIGMIDRNALKLMKKTAFIINTARGDLIVEEDLCTALAEGWIAGAGLDTFVHEPLDDSPLLRLNNVVLTPHAGATTYEAVNRMGVLAAEEVIRVLAGQEPKYRINRKSTSI